MRHLMAVAAFIALLQSADSVLAQSSARDEIIVHGQRVEDAMRAFVGEMAISSGTRERQIAHWDQAICTQLVGLPAAQSQFLADAIARRAIEVGLRARGPGCSPNILIFVTPDSDLLARALVQRYRPVFDAANSPNSSTLGETALSDFVARPRAVRWWFVSATTSYYGGRVPNSVARYGSAGQLTSVPTIHGSATRLHRSTRQDFAHAIIVVDARRVEGTTLATLGDYLAMTTLAQIDPNASLGHESILSLYTQPDGAPNAMTTGDAAYLDGLYHAPRAAANYHYQEGAIAQRMHQTLDH